MVRKRKLMALLVWCAIPAFSSETLAMSVDDLNLKLPFPDGETWKTGCVYDDSRSACSTHAKYQIDRYALDFNYHKPEPDDYPADDDCDKPIVAAASGQAEVYKGYNDRYGNYVFIRHAGGYYSRYAHLSEEGLVEDGAWVGRGEKIGECHQSGGQSSCHLHFVLYKDDKDGKRKSVKPQPMDGYNDFSSTTDDEYTSSNKGHGPLFNVFDKIVFPSISVDIAWFPAEVACEKAERFVIDGEGVSIDPKKACRDAYNDLVRIDRVYLSRDWKDVFFGDGDTSDSNLQCIQRGMEQWMQ